MDSPAYDSLYDRQIRFVGLGEDGQRRLAGGAALIVGVGGLGSWQAELLVRAGVGRLRLVDDDRVEAVNLHRQALYEEADVGRLKVEAAADRLGRLNPSIRVEPVAERIGPANAERLAVGMDVILDGTDNFAARFLINDLSVRSGIPWVFGGVVEARGQVATFVPGRTGCLRCLYDAPPKGVEEPRAATHGVLGPAVAAIASLQALEAIKVLSENAERAVPCLLSLDLWSNVVRRIDLASAGPRDDCPCCKGRRFDHLQA